jgi:ribosome-associated protein
VAATHDARRLALVAANAAADKKASDVIVLDVSDQLVITDCFVIASAPNERQVGAIVDSVEEKMRDAGTKPVRREGAREGRWVLLDFVDVVVHVQHAEERAYYALERLWKDCPTIPFVDRDAARHAAGVDTGGRERETLSTDDVDPGSADPTPLSPPPGPTST